MAIWSIKKENEKIAPVSKDAARMPAGNSLKENAPASAKSFTDKIRPPRQLNNK